MDCNFSEKNRWSGEVIAMSCGFVIFMILVMLIVWGGVDSLILLLLLLLCGVVLPVFAIFLFTPISLTVVDGNIRVRRVIGNIVIPISDVQSVRVVDKEEIRLSSRMVGSAGVFGYLGIFINKRLGRFTMYATERRNLIMVITEKRKYVFNCRDTDRFIGIYNMVKSLDKK